jgi:hypothetical protein
MGKKKRVRNEKTWICLLTVFIAFIPFYDGFGIKEFETEQAPALQIFRRLGNEKPSYFGSVYSFNILYGLSTD